MVALTTRYPTQPVVQAPKADARASTQVQITPQLIATKKTIEKIQKVAEFLATTEYLTTKLQDGRKIAIVKAESLNNIRPGMMDNLRGCTIYSVQNRQEMLEFIMKLGKTHGGEILPSFEELKKERDALKDDPINHRYDNTVYHTVLLGVSIAFFPPAHPKVADGAKKLSYLSSTLQQISEVEKIQKSMKSIFTSRIVMKQVLDTVKEYSSNEAFKNIDPDKWWKMPSRINALANLLSIKE
jgi:hypothetical protein